MKERFVKLYWGTTPIKHGEQVHIYDYDAQTKTTHEFVSGMECNSCSMDGNCECVQCQGGGYVKVSQEKISIEDEENSIKIEKLSDKAGTRFY